MDKCHGSTFNDIILNDLPEFLVFYDSNSGVISKKEHRDYLMNTTREKQPTKNAKFLFTLLFCLSLILPVTASAKMGAVTILDGDIIQEPGNGRMWQINRSKKMRSSTEVQEYLSNLNKGEHNDWRLPTKYELYDLFLLFALKENQELDIRLEMSYWLVGNNGKMIVGSWEPGDT